MTAPTPGEVRLAADVIQALSVSMDMPHPDMHWRPSELRAEAERIEQAAREEAARADMVELLAVELLAAGRWMQTSRLAELWLRFHPCGGEL